MNEVLQRQQLSNSVQPSARQLPIVKEAEVASDDIWDQFRTNKLSRDIVEDYLLKHGRTAQTLLAAFHSSWETNYLKEATTRFPNDPQLQWTILVREAFPGEQRKWIDLFKESSPEDSLANYLSAQDYLMNGDTNAAINELLEATRKPQFKDYRMESRLDEEELWLTAGKTQLESTHASGWAEDMLGQQALLKSVAYSLHDQEHQYIRAADASSAEHLAQIGMSLAQRLNSGAPTDLAINQLVGNSIEALVLSPLQQDATYEFLSGKTPAQRLDEIKQQRGSLQELTRSYRAIYPNLTEAELLTLKERQKIQGDVPAMRWVIQRFGTNGL